MWELGSIRERKQPFRWQGMGWLTFLIKLLSVSWGRIPPVRFSLRFFCTFPELCNLSSGVAKFPYTLVKQNSSFATKKVCFWSSLIFCHSLQTHSHHMDLIIEQPDPHNWNILRENWDISRIKWETTLSALLIVRANCKNSTLMWELF